MRPSYAQVVIGCGAPMSTAAGRGVSVVVSTPFSLRRMAVGRTDPAADRPDDGGGPELAGAVDPLPAEGGDDGEQAIIRGTPLRATPHLRTRRRDHMSDTAASPHTLVLGRNHQVGTTVR